MNRACKYSREERKKHLMETILFFKQHQVNLWSLNSIDISYISKLIRESEIRMQKMSEFAIYDKKSALGKHCIIEYKKTLYLLQTRLRELLNHKPYKRVQMCDKNVNYLKWLVTIVSSFDDPEFILLQLKREDPILCSISEKKDSYFKKQRVYKNGIISSAQQVIQFKQKKEY